MKDEVEEKLKLIDEALMDWKAGKLTALAALTAIHITAGGSTKVSAEALRWANTALSIKKGGMTYA